ncbi:rod shape-determining protein MreC [Pseudothauera rhizosphaerae]|uniref:Cell shape-determining protein MreC n=1 Tax=Pseudothauera rhizosphaerae TaxID=2565932 RepID=A0A4S4AQU1_9RHOO|nr:rod shape-determining protein MreC [Pseudothauera rhizosphaerae]THF62104.1 rod shape-determining protein MreC [Pseudothauera rhizosphaerae]
MSLVGHQAPPIFRRGPTPLARLILLVSICLAMMVADIKFRYLDVLRQGISVVTYPLQMAAAAPADFVLNASHYFATLIEVQMENAELRRQLLDAAQLLLRFDHLQRENEQLRGLVQMAERVPLKSVSAEILYNAPDPFARKVILNRGTQHGVEAGLAVVDARGVIGQVTRVYPVQAEVTLLTDKNQAIAVEVVRNGLRGVLFGSGQGRLEMRFVLAGADIVPGDELVTSGLDGVFPSGLPVATVSRVERESQGQAFNSIACEPAAGIESSIQVLVVGRAELPPPPPSAQKAPAAPPGRS